MTKPDTSLANKTGHFNLLTTHTNGALPKIGCALVLVFLYSSVPSGPRWRIDNNQNSPHRHGLHSPAKAVNCWKKLFNQPAKLAERVIAPSEAAEPGETDTKMFRAHEVGD